MTPDTAPLFPLPLVLFPGQLKVLRIFEPRYRIMLRQCLDGEQPFGIVLAKAGSAAEPDPLPHRVGTLAHITEVQRLPDESFAIRIYGGDRFRITLFEHDRPFLQGRIEILTLLQTESDEAYALHKHLARLLPNYIEALTQASGLQFALQTLPPEPEELAFLTALALQVNNEQKQSLLACDHLPTLMRRELQLLGSELDLMAWISDTLEQTNARGFGTGGALHLN